MKQNIYMQRTNQSLSWQGINAVNNSMNCRNTTISVILATGNEIRHLGRDGPPGRVGSSKYHFGNAMYLTISSLVEFIEEKSMIINNILQTKIQFITNIYFLKS